MFVIQSFYNITTQKKSIVSKFKSLQGASNRSGTVRPLVNNREGNVRSINTCPIRTEEYESLMSIKRPDSLIKPKSTLMVLEGNLQLDDTKH